MFNLVIDAGNSYLKFGIFLNNQLIKRGKYEYNDSLKQNLVQLFKLIDIQKVAISSVINEDIIKLLPIKNQEVINITNKSKFPFKINYKTPETLGIDRIIGCTAAVTKYGNPVLIIDIGTCITFDFVDSDKIYQGGAISPGLQIRLKSMNTLTKKLPLIDFKKSNIKSPIGKSTEECMLNGVYFGIKSEIEFHINYYLKKYPDLNVILTGGDLNIFEVEINCSIFALPNLILEGLNDLIELNAE
jgi:type III pantothenate kinase